MIGTAESFEYAPTAYRSDRETPVVEKINRQSAVFRKSWTMGSPLPRGDLSGTFPLNFLQTWGPKEAAEDDENLRRFKAEAEAGGGAVQSLRLD